METKNIGGSLIMDVKKAGADAGNNGLKLWVKDEEPMMIPTSYYMYYGESSDLMDQEDISKDDLISNIDITINSKSLKENGIRYIIGEKVLKDNEEATELEERSDKSFDELPVIVTLAGLAVSEMKNNMEDDHLTVTYDLGVALPVSTITPEKAKNNASRFMGQHEVIYHHPSGRNVYVTITIQFCKCLPEGAAAAWGIVYNEDGSVKERAVELDERVVNTTMQNKELLHFDIGAGSTECVITNGVAFDPKLSIGLNYGIKKTMSKIVGVWNNEHPSKPIDTMVEFNNIYFDQEHPRHTALVKKSDIPIKQLATRLSKEMINQIDSRKDDPHVFIYGGGADVLKSSLLDILEQYGRSKNVHFLRKALYQNAYGLLVYTTSPTFEKAKEKELGVVNHGEEK